MASIAIKNIGPLNDTGILPLSQFNIFIGKQSTGKSTLLKILCFCKWIEKRIMIKDEKTLSNYTHYSRFLKELMQFHRINKNFFNPRSEIHFVGDCIAIDLVGNKNVKITRLPNFTKVRHNTKLSFIPSERNLVSAIKNVDRTYRTNDFDVLFNHVFEWGEAKENYTEEHPIDLKIVESMDYYYDPDQGDVLRLKDRRLKFSPFYASSGVQSVLPIMVMVDYFTGPIFDRVIDLNKKEVTEVIRMLSNIDSTDEAKSKPFDIDAFSRVYNYMNTQLFIEEPEQNLFPESQQTLVEYLVRSINRASQATGSESSVTLTTHSPYIITAFNVLLRAYKAKEKDENAATQVIPSQAIVPLYKVCAYYIKTNGNVSNIVDLELGMISGLELDAASDIVENKLSLLDDIIYGEA